MSRSDVIVALATPPGRGALMVVRLSGGDAVAVADRIFRGRSPLRDAPSHALRLGLVTPIGRSDEPIDELLAVVMRAPRSYTGEDVVEFSGHGSPAIGHALIEALIDAGARPALPGEFTRRAVLNGRLDLLQAEAVADLIGARGERARRNALMQLRGGLSGRIRDVREPLLSLLARLEAFLDFGDDVPEPPMAAELREGFAGAGAAIENLLAGQARGRLLMEGATVALAGRPNVGKSSLLNQLAGQDRALVHDRPGTTRDLVDAEISLQGFPIRLIDTAGIRVTHDPVESAGIDRARSTVAGADLALLVLEAPEPPRDDDRMIAELIADRPCLVVRNKIDLGDDPESRRFAETVARAEGEVLPVSARHGDGVPELLARLSVRLVGAAGDEEGMTMTAARHYESLRSARTSLARAAAALAGGEYPDMIAADLRDSLSALGGITGEGVAGDVLDRIFATFCIGK